MSGIFSCVTKNSLAGWKAPDHGCQNLKVSSAAEFRPIPAESGLGAAKSSVENEGRFGRVFGFAGIYNGSVTLRQHEWYRISMNKYIYIVEWYVCQSLEIYISLQFSHAVCPSGEGGLIRCPCAAFAKAILLGSRCFWYSLASAGGNAALRAGSSGRVSVLAPL